MAKTILTPLLALSLPVAVMAAGPGIAYADAPKVTITVAATAKLLDPTLVRVPATITCAPLDVYTDQGGAELKQAVVGRIAYGQGWREQPIVCDGKPHANNFLIWVDTASPAPFRQGNATVQASAYLCPPPPTPNDACESGGSGVQVIRLKP
jgi:hypothetical protein